ncbi:hypothetical protein PNIG_b0655 [Pseudoalteromonas nigrifaciens]|uniref:Uncharacterized protein n=1 Tax=Pseudoalteromonas nigrifaciens TaxID=28109 RepID=A0AAC9XZ93_9GAMM|nr:hypothetical protein PNIG_b0655 [Pseudoalteromonas nigrifaciens]
MHQYLQRVGHGANSGAVVNARHRRDINYAAIIAIFHVGSH